MSDHRIKVDVELDTSKAKKQLDDLTKQKQKVEIDVDASKLKEASKEIEDIGKRKQQKIQLDVNTSELDEAVKKINHLKQGKIHIKANVDGTKAVDNMAKSYDTAKKSAQGLGTSIKELAKLGLSFQTIEQSARAAVEAISDIYNATLDLQMATGDSYSEVRNMVSGYNDMAKSLGAITTEVTSGADTWLRSGKSLAETNMLIKDTMVLSKNAKMTSEDSSKVLTATLNGFQLAADQASHVNDILSSIDMSSSSDAGGIGTALTKTASMAHNAGLSLEKTAASIATIKEVTQDSDESIGNALKSMLSRMNQIKAGKFIDAETGEALNDTEKVLKAVGINMRDVNGQFLDAETIIDNVGKKWLMFDRNTQKAIATAMGGTYQYNKLISLFDNYNKVLSLTETAQNSNGVALQKFNDAYLNSLEAKKKSLQASFESLSVNLISKESISGIMEATQSVIEFLDHTNLLKTALTGLAVGGAIKGFTMLTTSITQAAMKMQNFSSAMSLLKTGNIGTDGVKQLTTLVDGLSQSQLKAVLSSQNLTNAQRMQILQSTGLSKAQAAAKLSTMGLATAEGAATATTVTFSGALKGLWATLMTNPIVLITTALTAGISIWNAYQQSVEETIQTAKDASNAWKESTSSLDEQISKYKELKAKLASGDLSEAEEYNVKQQILEIQNQITSQYPEQAAGVDLVNGNLQTQLGLLQQIAVENAKSTLNENRKEFHDVEKAMTKKRHYSLGDTGVTNEIEGVGKDIYDIAKEFEKQGIVLQDTGMNTGIFTISFDGDASKADQVINDFMNRVSTLQSEYEGQDFATEQIESVLNYSGKALSANKEILDDYQESYQTFLQMDMVANEKLFSVDYDKSKKSYGQLYEDYADAVEKYNEALSSGDTSKIEEAKTSFEGVQSIKNQQDVAGKLQSQVRLYQDEINKLMENGSMAKWSTEWYEAQAALNGFKEEAAEAETTLIELQDQLRELDLLKLQQAIDELDRTAKRLENNTDLTESKGEQISEKDLQAQLDNANAQIQANYNKRQELLRDQAKYDVGSEKYNEIAEEIEKLDDSIYDAMENIEDLKNKIWEVRWEPFFDGQEALGDLIDQTDDLRGLLNSDAFVGKNGGLTLDGIANIALINQGMIAAKQQIKNYNEALKKLDEDLKNGNISTSEYKEQQKEFMDGIANSVGVVEDYRDSIVDLYKQQLEAENDMAQKSIDKYSELLDIKKKNAEYSKNLRKQTKDINVLKTQIAALDSVNNEAAKAEKKRLEAQLADAESQLEDTRRDHEYDVRKNGYEGLSDDLNKELEDTLNDITYNSEKQEQVISNMLGKIVGMYDKAYDKIQQIINSTGFVPNGSLSNNIGSLGTSSGAQNQFNNGITTAPNYRPDNFTNVNTGQIQNGTTQNNNDWIQGEISKNPDLSKRPVAEITLSPLTLSIQEGSTANISATIRPNDAKNKSLQWMSSNPDVAAVVNGTVRAIKTGSATISAIATDGGGATSSNSCAVTVTPKPEPPKPTPPQNKPNTGGGDGVPNVGDKVIFASGDYYYSSDGQSPAGNEMRGQEVYITSVNNESWAQRKIHISRTPRFGERDLGWVSLDQLKGYASGTKKIANAEEVARVNEGNKRELLIRYGSATGNAAVFHYGDSVVKADLANNIVELAKNKDDIFQTLNRTNNSTTNPTIINNHNHYDNMINVQGSIDKETYPGMKKVIEGVTKEFTKEAHRMGMHRTL